MVVLVVDDEQLFRSCIKTILQKEGFQIIEAGDGIDACKIIREIGSSINLLLAGINMPRMDGLSLAESARISYPKMPILLMTGQAPSLQNLMDSYVVLHRPFLRQVLLEAVWKIITAAAIEDNSPASVRNSNVSRLELREHWQTEARKAKDRYHAGSLHLRKILAEYNQGLTPTPDGSFAVRQALVQESAARQEHMRVLRILTHIITSDKRPKNQGR